MSYVCLVKPTAVGILMMALSALLACGEEATAMPLPAAAEPSLSAAATLPPASTGTSPLANVAAPSPAPASGAAPQQVMPAQNHVTEGTGVAYNTTPPTSGIHWPRWADCGFYPEGLPDELIVHNLEHSNVVISYNLASREEADALRNAVDSIDDGGAWAVVRYYEKLDTGTVALAAWGMLDTMDGVDVDRIRSFFGAYAIELGPERIPC